MEMRETLLNDIRYLIDHLGALRPSPNVDNSSSGLMYVRENLVNAVSGLSGDCWEEIYKALDENRRNLMTTRGR